MDYSQSFQQALEANDGELLILAVKYRVTDVKLMVHGFRVRSVILVLPDTETRFAVGNDCTIRDLKFMGHDQRHKTGNSIIACRVFRSSPQMAMYTGSICLLPKVSNNRSN